MISSAEADQNYHPADHKQDTDEQRRKGTYRGNKFFNIIKVLIARNQQKEADLTIALVISLK